MRPSLHPPIHPAWKQNKALYEWKWEGLSGLERQAGRQADREIASGARQDEAVAERRDRGEDSGVGGGDEWMSELTGACLA